MLTSAVTLWLTVLYLLLLQIRYLWFSRICSVPVHMSKNAMGVAILAVAYWGNANFQTLTIYLAHNPSYDTVNPLQGPAQLASIVGIMTGTLIQIWFNPRLVTQTELLFVASVVNWILVFVLEAFVFPYQSSDVPISCGVSTSSNCFLYDGIPHSWYLSGVIATGVGLIAIAAIYIHEVQSPHDRHISKTNSVLRYLNVTCFRGVVTTMHGCTGVNPRGELTVDHGILLVKNMFQVSTKVISRTSNAYYCLLFELLPTHRLRCLYSQLVGSVLTIHVKEQVIICRSSYMHLLEMGLLDTDPVHGYLS
ncbi:hypothetical protein ACHHYP_13484 [Achlya hypogyna]|uniref:Uncharacterized protein n=1 Tax=Achlya hypogyna TaxID=1202772 RepID=A0A1V9YF69_ACHHY|nr:hypothetical protein ACHHYP_13484 [Achlya hypogyna]